MYGVRFVLFFNLILRAHAYVRTSSLSSPPQYLGQNTDGGNAQNGCGGRFFWTAALPYVGDRGARKAVVSQHTPGSPASCPAMRHCWKFFLVCQVLFNPRRSLWRKVTRGFYVFWRRRQKGRYGSANHPPSPAPSLVASRCVESSSTVRLHSCRLPSCLSVLH